MASSSGKSARLSRVALGCMRTTDWGANMTVPQAHKLLSRCVDRGVTTVEVADHYGGTAFSVPALVGRVLEREPSLRGRMDIVVKVGQRGRAADHSAAHLVRAVDRVLELMHCERADVLLLQGYDPLAPVDGAFDAFRELKRAGKVRRFGVSHRGVAQTRALAARCAKTTPLEVCEFECSAMVPAALLDGTMEMCAELGMRPVFASPCAGGDVFRKPRSKQQQRVQRALDQVADELASSGAMPGARPATVAVAWLLTVPTAATVLVGTTDADHVPELAAGGTVELTREQWYLILRAAGAAPPLPLTSTRAD